MQQLSYMAAHFFLTACCFNLLWRYVSYHSRLLHKDADPRAVAAISRQYLFGPLFTPMASHLSWLRH